MRIFFADKFPSQHLQRLADAGHETSYMPDLQASDLPGAICGMDALVVRSTRVDKDAIAAGDKLSIIIRAGAGTNTIDKGFAAENGVAVCNVPGKNAVAVAELTLGLLLSIDRNIPDNVRELREGQWNKKLYSTARGLMGRTIGIIGAGAIGMAVAERAAAFGLKVIMIQKPGRSEKILERMAAVGIHTVDSMDDLAAASDIVSVHVPAAAGTKNLIDQRFLAKMKDSAILLNTSRGDVIDEQALLAALDSKSLRAGLDVYLDEPAASQGEFHSAVARHPRVYGTHHIGASTEQAQNAVAEGVIDIINALADNQIINRVN